MKDVWNEVTRNLAVTTVFVGPRRRVETSGEVESHHGHMTLLSFKHVVSNKCWGRYGGGNGCVAVSGRCVGGFVMGPGRWVV